MHQLDSAAPTASNRYSKSSIKRSESVQLGKDQIVRGNPKISPRTLPVVGVRLKLHEQCIQVKFLFVGLAGFPHEQR
jgi:hypothetical protein